LTYLTSSLALLVHLDLETLVMRRSLKFEQVEIAFDVFRTEIMPFK